MQLVLWAKSYIQLGDALPDSTHRATESLPMDPRWQPHLGATQPTSASPEACSLLAAGWRAEAEECWISAGDGPARLVALDTWRSLRDRAGFIRSRLQIQQT